MLKEILKIDSANPALDKEANISSNVKQESSPAASVHHERAGYASHQRPLKKLGKLITIFNIHLTKDKFKQEIRVGVLVTAIYYLFKKMEP